MEGTRENVFKEVDEWLDDSNSPNILRIIGSPGAGKSAIASSLETRLRRRYRLGSCFFFRRGDMTMNDPTAVWRTVAYDLARFDTVLTDELARVLDEEKRVDVGRPDIASHFKFLVAEPLTKFQDHFSTLPAPVDALDECGPEPFQRPQRRALLHTLAHRRLLPRTFKLIITGRDERIPEVFRTACKLITLPTGSAVDADANNDIRSFLQECFAQLEYSSDPEWPGRQTLDVLTTRATGLFIWADVVVKSVERGLPEIVLQRVASGSLGDASDIAKLYREVLNIAFRDIDDGLLEVARRLLAAIALAKVPLHLDDLVEILVQPETSLKSILHRLSSVISTGHTDRCLRIVHLSFSHFVCDPKQCPAAFFIDKDKESSKLALRCFQLMKSGLKFNICDIESSFTWNHEISPETLDQKISRPLQYACNFWASHLQDTSLQADHNHCLIAKLEEFYYHNLLYWLEAMSLMSKVAWANATLLTVAKQTNVSIYFTLLFMI